MKRAFALAMLGLAACAHAPRAGDAEDGQASVYADRFEGHRTASGQTFHVEALTCAHRTLPFGTLLEVERLDAPYTVRVTVNDRGPFVHGRVLDLSPRAARALHLQGVAPVRLHVLRVGPAR